MIRRNFLTLTAVMAFAAVPSCGSLAERTKPVSAQENYFGSADGCFLLYNLKTETFEKVIGEARCRERFVACSTFKVPLAVAAFDSKALRDVEKTLKWNGAVHSRPVLNRDHNAKTWMNQSVVWFSQQLTAKLGKTNLQSYLDRFEYGNRDLTAGIDDAWLVSPAESGPALTISGYEQVEFMKNLWKNKLPASMRAMKQARDLTFLEISAGGTKLHGKTGSNFYNEQQTIHLGWFISHIERDDHEFIAVANFSDRISTAPDQYGGPRAKEIIKRILMDRGIW